MRQRSRPAIPHVLLGSVLRKTPSGKCETLHFKTLELDPSFSNTPALVGRVHAAKSMYREAVAEAEKYSENRGSAISIAILGYGHAQVNERSQALRALDELRALSKQRYVSSYFFGLVYLGLSEKHQALAWLEKAYEERSGLLPLAPGEPKLGRLAL